MKQVFGEISLLGTLWGGGGGGFILLTPRKVRLHRFYSVWDRSDFACQWGQFTGLDPNF